jgi:hypothetical protein
MSAMRTTIRLKGELLEMAKEKAASQGRTLTAFIEDAVRAELAAKPPTKKIVLPVFKGDGLQQGADLIKTNALEDEWDSERWRNP